MKEKIFQTQVSWTPLVLRVLLGLVIFPHGAQKLFGWFGGYGFSGTMNYFTDTMGIPWIFGLTVILLESVGSIALIVGIATRLIAGFYMALALGIIFTSHIQHGFFMNWYGSQQGEGIEYFILWIGMALALFISGAGKHSFDRQLITR